MNANKVIPEKLVAVLQLYDKFTFVNKDRDQSQSSIWRTAIGRGLRL